MDLVFTLEEIEKAAHELLDNTRGHGVFALHGEMGAGKTTLIHSLCKILGVNGHMSSPTFSIINEYPTANGSIFHLDLYRLRDEAEAIASGVEDCLLSGATCFVEWPEKAPGIFPAETIHVYILATGPSTRQIAFAPGEQR